MIIFKYIKKRHINGKQSCDKYWSAFAALNTRKGKERIGKERKEMIEG